MFLDAPPCWISRNILKGKQLEQAIQSLVYTLFPGCNVTNVRRVSGALTNAVYFVTVGNTTTLLLRVYGIGSDEFIDRSNELLWLNRLAHLKLGPRLLAIFGNGRFEEFLPSTTLTHSDLQDPVLSAQIARRFRQLHSLIDIYPPASPDEMAIWHSVDRWFETLQQESHSLPFIFDFDRLGREIDQCKAFLKNTSPIVFAHNDVQYGNVLRLKGTANTLVLVDFEYAGYNPRGYDIANHFIEWTYNYHGDTPALMCPDAFPSTAQQIRFLKEYANGDDNLVDSLLVETRQWLMAVHLHWGLWGLVQACHSEIDFDYISYALERIGAFRKELQKMTVDQ
ncbi:hypothetical protein O0I10_005123 [Lichtheimia ornata]|uniref:Uncharacterized protein n=1 Tax=Lichtheimia ornata TaxID=688661 RepID=A0AAD7V6B1_9FUNG|nr:uncharacterized protein O0I10_005123 [Lichtheimia ornata]KAJ8659085.1 hypothetical protein O0I10_005123 [Lichtheimia ornata]